MGCFKSVVPNPGSEGTGLRNYTMHAGGDTTRHAYLMVQTDNFISVVEKQQHHHRALPEAR